MDTQGILQSCFDPATNSLRISSAGDTQSFPVGSLELIAGTRTLVVTNNVPRLSLIDGVTTSFGFTFWPPPTWANIGFGFWWTTDTAAAGNVRWRVAVKKHFNEVSNISAAFDADVSANIAVPTAGVVRATIDQVSGLSAGPGFFGAMYTVVIERTGADAGDTHAGTAALLGAYARKNPA